MYDAVVVGAGPTGGMAARALAVAGFRTAILEKKKVVGEPVQCAEGVSEFGLASNGLRPRDEWVAQRVSGAKCIVPNGTWFYITRLPGYAINRPMFDRWLVDGRRDGGLLPQGRHRRRPEDADHRGFDSVAVRPDRARGSRPSDRRRCRGHHEPTEWGGNPPRNLQRADRGRVRGDRIGAGGSNVHDGVRPGDEDVPVPRPSPVLDDRPHPSMGRSADKFRRRGIGRTRLAGRQPADGLVRVAAKAVVGNPRA